MIYVVDVWERVRMVLRALCEFFYMFGLLGGAVTSLALGTPMISAVFCHVFHLDPAGQFINVMVIFIWTLVPLFILFLDLKRCGMGQ